MITLGTGLGTGIIANGEIVYGHDGCAGELGHMTIDYSENARQCLCGKKGCLEAYASAKGMINTTQELLNKHPELESKLRDLREDEMNAYEIYLAAKKGDIIANKVFEITGDVLGKACANFTLFSSPEAYIFFGSFLSVVTGNGKDGCDEDSLFLGYLIATNTVKKIAEIQRFNLPLPNNKEFFSPSKNKEELDRLLIEANQKRKENAFILDGNTNRDMILKPYNPLLDKNLGTFLNSKNNKNFLQINGFVGKDGKIIYDPTYRETLGFNSKNRANKYRSIPNIKLSKVKTKKFKTVANATNKFLAGFRAKSPGYSIYNQRKAKNKLLPPIHLKNKLMFPNQEKKELLFEKIEEIDGSREASGNVSEKESFRGSGDSNERKK